MKYYSQTKQDEVLHQEIFLDKRNGVFVEFGAHNGIAFSNTKFFEDELEWTGLCVEPNLHAFEDLGKNRKCICEFGAVVGNDYTEDEIDFILVSKNLEQLSGVQKYMDPRHHDRLKREFELHGGTTNVIKVPALKLNDLLDKYEMYHIDYLSIDTEGGELEIIKSIDFDKYDIRVITVENNYFETIFIDWFKNNRKDYTYYKRLGADDVFIKNV